MADAEGTPLMAESFRLRLRSVRYKDGRAPLRVVYSDKPHLRKALMKNAQVAFHHHPKPAGMAIVVWDADCNSSVKVVVTDASTIPTILVPDFVRNRLLADRIETWTIQSLADGALDR